MKSLIASLEARCTDPHGGLPEELFLFVSRVTPLVNVDLLIRNQRRETLLTWRDDGFDPPGWHIPGGIVRFKEGLPARIRAVAAGELGAQVTFGKTPLAVHEMIHPSRQERGHFISLLFACRLRGSPDPARRHERGAPRPGVWSWHAGCPRNLIGAHRVYRKFF